jgi:hypothetical protein
MPRASLQPRVPRSPVLQALTGQGSGSTAILISPEAGARLRGSARTCRPGAPSLIVQVLVAVTRIQINHEMRTNRSRGDDVPGVFGLYVHGKEVDLRGAVMVRSRGGVMRSRRGSTRAAHSPQIAKPVSRHFDLHARQERLRGNDEVIVLDAEWSGDTQTESGGLVKKGGLAEFSEPAHFLTPPT